jgi:WD40 repeat protein
VTTFRNALSRERDRALAYVFGRDVFISYARGGKGLEYARGLANALRQLNEPLTVYFDQWAAPPGAELPPTLLLALRRVNVLVVVATEESLQSSYVAQEIAAFARLPRSIVAIDSGCLEKAREEKRCWPAVLNGVWAREAAIERGAPTPEVIRHIAEIVGDATQQRRLQNVARRTAIGFVAIVLAAAAVTLGTWWFAQKARREAELQTHRSLVAAAAAANAESRLRATDVQKTLAEARAKQAAKETRTAEEFTRRALEQKNAADAEKQIAQQLGHALALANRASVILGSENPNDLPLVARLAAEAVREADRLGIQSPQINQVARNILELMPLVHDPLKNHNVEHVFGTSPDATLAAIRTYEQILIVNLVTGKSVALAEIADPDRVFPVSFSGNGLRCGARMGHGAGTVVRVWDVESGLPVGPAIAAPASESFVLDFTGEHLALRKFGVPASTLRVVNVASGETESGEVEVGINEKQFAFSPTEPLLVFSNHQQLLQWRWRTERDATPIGSIEDTGYGFHFLFTRSGELAAAVFRGDRAVLNLWSFHGGGFERKWRRERDSVRGMVLSLDHSKIATWDGNSVTVLSVAAGEQQHFLSLADPQAVAISSWYLAVATQDVLKVFDLETMLEIDRVRSSNRYNLRTWPSEIRIRDNTIMSVLPTSIQQWGNDPGPIARVNAMVHDFAFLPDEETITVISDLPVQDVMIFTADGKPIDSWVKTPPQALSIAAASGRRILVGDSSGNVSIHTPFRALTPLAHPGEGAVVELAVSRTSRYVAAATKSGVSVWSDWMGLSPKRVQLKSAAKVSALAFGANDGQLVTGSEDGTVRVWNWRTGTAGPPMKSGPCCVRSVSVDGKGSTVASVASGGTVDLWDIPTGRKRKLRHDQNVQSAAFDPSGEYIATISNDFYVRIWSIVGTGSPQVVTRIPHDFGFSKIAFSASGRKVGFGGWLTLSAWKQRDLFDALCQRVDCSKAAPQIY